MKWIIPLHLSDQEIDQYRLAKGEIIPVVYKSYFNGNPLNTSVSACFHSQKQ